MITIIGILVGAIIIALVWMCVYFNQEIHDVMAEMRAKAGNYAPYYKTNYGHGNLYWEQKYKALKADYDELQRQNEEMEELLMNEGDDDD